MPATKVPVIYSATTGRVRSWVVFNRPEETDALLGTVTLGQGEGVLLVDLVDYGDINTLQSLVTQHTGLTPDNDRYAVVDDLGDVVGIVIADVACGDTVPGKELVAHSKASPGWSYDGTKGEFTDPDGAVVAAETP